MATNKAKGTAFESVVVKLFEECGFTTCRRVVMHGSAGDQGDLWLGVEPNKPQVIIECKSRKIEVAYKGVEDFIKEAHTEYKNALKTEFAPNCCALVFIKRPNLGVKDGYLVWKNGNNITIRARIGDVLDKTNFEDIDSEEERIATFIDLLAY